MTPSSSSSSSSNNSGGTSIECLASGGCRGIIIVFTGNIGAGKSTAIERLADEMKRAFPNKRVHVMRERVDPELLKLLYSGGAPDVSTAEGMRWIFQHQKAVGRWKDVIAAKQLRARGDIVLMDTDPSHDAVFARVNLSSDQFALYERMLEVHRREIGFEPDMRFVLRTSPVECVENIAARASTQESRRCELSIGVDYLERLHAAFLDAYPDCDDVADESPNVIVQARHFNQHATVVTAVRYLLNACPHNRTPLITPRLLMSNLLIGGNGTTSNSSCRCTAIRLALDVGAQVVDDSQCIHKV